MKILACGFLIVVVFESSLAQSHELHGVVKDAQSGERLPNAMLVIKGTTIGTKTNLEGYFVLGHVPDTAFTLQSRYVGYEVTEIVIDPAKEADNVVLEMRAQDIILQGVTVVGQEATILKTENETSLATISPKQLATLPSAGQADIFRSMQLLPGISGTNDRSSGLYVRGGTPDQNLVLFDGMTVYHVDHFFGFFSAFNPDAVKDVQFYKGGFPATYGGRLSSVVDMIGKSGDPDNLHIGAGINLLSANAIVEIPVFDNATFLLAARRSYSEVISTGAYTSLYNFLTGSSGTTLGPRGFGRGGGGRFGAFSTQQTPTPMFYDLDSKLTYTLSPDDILSASFYSSLDDLNKSQQSSTQTLANSNFQIDLPSQTDDTKQGNLGASAKWFHQWTNSFFTNLVVATAKYTSSYHYQIDRINPNLNAQNAQSTDEDNSINDNSLRLDNDFILNASHRVSFGAQISQMTVRYALSATTVFDQAQSNLLDLNQKAVSSSLYLQDKWKIAEPFTVTLGLRATNYSLTSQNFLEPRASWRYELTEHVSLKGAYGIYHQFTNRIINEDLTQGSRDFWVLAQNNLQPGKADHYILGGTWENDDYIADVEAYYKVLDNLVEFSQRFRRTADDVYRFFLGNGTAKGIEVLLQKKHGSLNGWISYTLGKAEDVFPDFNNGNPFPAEQDQRHELKIVGNLSLGANWMISSDFVFGSGTPYTAPVSQYTIGLLDNTTFQYTHVSDKNAYRLPDYQRLDLSISKGFGDERSSHWVVGLSAFNLLNHKNISYYQYDLNSNPIHITEVTGLGITPTVFVQVDFR
ncbi:MAG TPA: TonB-dependent receptor [Bacteroidota bacterium]|nr:TonB-dependent receptor [Bacteroidota bacterium]